VLSSVSTKVQNEVRAVVDLAATSGRKVHVYAEAEQIRQANLADNIALEDIVQAFLNCLSGSPGSILNPEEARNALLGVEPSSMS
jgi:hypothetical protein